MRLRRLTWSRWRARARAAEAALAGVHELADLIDGGVTDSEGRWIGLHGPIAADLIRRAAETGRALP